MQGKKHAENPRWSLSVAKNCTNKMDKTNCNAILATRYLILVTWYALPDICYLLLDTCNLIQLPWYLVPNICCKIILTWYLLFVPLNLLTEAKYLILIFVNWNFLHVTYLCDTCQWIPDQWYFLQNARCPHTCSKYLRRESIYYNGWPIIAQIFQIVLWGSLLSQFLNAYLLYPSYDYKMM